MKAWKIALITGTAGIAAISYAAFPFDDVDGRTYGPFNCPACQGQFPIPDDATSAFIKRYELENRRITAQVHTVLLAGAKMVICNGSVCITYQKTTSTDWYGIRTETIIRNPPPRAGTGSGKGSGGSGGIGGGAGDGTAKGSGKGGSARDDGDAKGVVSVGSARSAKEGRK